MTLSQIANCCMIDAMGRQEFTVGKSSDSCQTCGQPVRVRILKGYTGGKPMLEHFCSKCADEAQVTIRTTLDESAKQRLSIGALLIFAGLFVGIIGVFGDYLGIEGHSGFGWHQQVGIVLATVFVLVGSLFRVDTLAVVGVVAFGLSVFADLFGLTSAPGIGWKQQLATSIGIAIVLTGILLKRRARHATEPSQRTGLADQA